MRLVQKQVLKIDKMYDGVELPRYATDGAACMDLRYYSEGGEDAPLVWGRVTMLGTGLRVEVPEGYELQIRARSGLSCLGVILVNGIGTIDSDYRGEIKVPLMNISGSDILVRHGERVAQVILSPVTPFRCAEVVTGGLSKTRRQDGGFGHTGTA